MDDCLVWLVGLCLGFLVLFIYEKQKVKNLPPGPWGLPVLGYLPWINPKEPYKTLEELSIKYGGIYSLSMGSVFTVVLTDPALIKEAFARDDFTARADLWLTHGMMKGHGLIASEGEKWREQRKFVASFLKSNGMVKIGSKRGNMEARILDGVSEACKMLLEHGHQPIEPLKILIHCMGNIVNQMIFGISWAYGDPQWEWLQELAVVGVKLIGIAGPINFLPFLRFWPKYKRTIKYLLEGKDETHKLYKEIAQNHNHGDDLLSQYQTQMNHQVKYFTEEQMYHVLADMWGAGVDTSLTTLRWFLLYVAVNPNIQERVYDELKQVMGNRLEPSLEDIPFMPYLGACIYETLRIRPVVPLGIPHGTTTETVLGGYRIPSKTMVVALQWALHLNSRVFENPQKFQPERFISDEGKLIKSHEYVIPFQNGKRACIGEEMAKMMLHLFAAGILCRFRVVVGEGVNVDEALAGVCGITLAPGAHTLIFENRNA